MNSVRCPKCAHSLPPELLGAGGAAACPACRTPLEVIVFPALLQPAAAGPAAEPVRADGETNCFFHPAKKAAIVCDFCGRFLCTLCDVPVGGAHLCPKCVAAGRTKKTLTTFENSRTSYPSLALTLAFLPLLVWPITLLTGPAAVFLALFGWGKPPSLTGRRRRGALVAALLMGLMECAGWAAVFFGFFNRANRG